MLAHRIRHLGAWEVAARCSRLSVDHDAFPVFADPRSRRKPRRNWYPNRYLKFMTDYAHTRFSMATSSIKPLHGENVIMSRIQLAF